MALAPVTVTLALVSGPDPSQGENPEQRIEMRVVLDTAGRLDAEAWQADPASWTARRIRPDSTPIGGDVWFEPDHGWTLRFWRSEGEEAEAPPALLDPGPDPLRPGEYVTVTAASGKQYGYRVVGVDADPLPDIARQG